MANPLFLVKVKITERELSDYAKDLVNALSHGGTVEEIAASFNRSHRTVEKHLSDIRLQYEAKNVTHLVAIFLRKKII